MLYELLTVASLLTGALSLVTSGVTKNDVTSNYVVWGFQSSSTYFPYAINKCQASGLTSTAYYLFSCSDDKKSVTLEQHESTTCDDPDPVSYMINATGYDDSGFYTYFGYDTTEDGYRGKYGAFECNGVDAYASVSFDFQKCAAVNAGTGATVHAAVSACVNLPSGRSLNVYCSPLTMTAQMQYFMTADYPTCDATNTSETNYANSTCGYIFTFGPDIYGQLLECAGTDESSSSTTTTTTTTEEPKSNAILFSSFFSLFIIIISFFLLQF